MEEQDDQCRGLSASPGSVPANSPVEAKCVGGGGLRSALLAPPLQIHLFLQQAQQEREEGAPC